MIARQPDLTLCFLFPFKLAPSEEAAAAGAATVELSSALSWPQERALRKSRVVKEGAGRRVRNPPVARGWCELLPTNQTTAVPTIILALSKQA